MTRIVFVLIVALAVLSSPATGAGQGPDVQPSEPGQGRHCLWRVIGPTGTQVFLLGSIHALPDDAYPLDDAINDAFAAAETVFFEVDLDDEDLGGRMMAAGSQPAGRRLADSLDPETRREFDLYLKASDMTLDTFDAMKPWMAALSLTSIELMRAGYSADAGVDVHLARRARQDGKTIGAFETGDYQIGLFSGMDENESLAFLRYALKEMDTVVLQLGRLTRAWKNGDIEVLSSLLTDAFVEEPALFERMVSVRNRAWLPQIEELLRANDNAMVVVGALHLVGKTGLIELLRDQGYQVEQL